MKKINIAELLKDCPKGMELDCLLYDNVTFERFDVEQNRCYFKAGPADTFWTTCYGKVNGSPFGKCIIFPKGKTTWEGFVPPYEFKDGDIVTWKDSMGSLVACIYKERLDISFSHHIALYKGGLGIIVNGEIILTNDELRLATEEEKARLFQAIKDNGYKWNTETKTLEKLVVKPKFKDGDRVVKKGDISTPVSIVRVGDKYYYHYSNTEGTIGLLPIAEQDDWELVPTKFDITTLVPFESRVLVRDSIDGIEEYDGECSAVWRPATMGVYTKDSDYPFGVVGGCYFRYCIPYEGNEHLLGTTDDCDERFKTW